MEARKKHGDRIIEGYGAVFYDPKDPGTEYRMGSFLVERISRGAFDRSLREGDIRSLWNHDSAALLGGTSSGTLKLHIDSKGLRYSVTLPNSIVGEMVYESVDRGDVDGSSFGFRPIKTRFERGAGGAPDVANLEEVRLDEVSPVSWPAYTSTSVSVALRGIPGSVRYEHEMRKRLPFNIRQRLDQIDFDDERFERLAEIDRDDMRLLEISR